ncbi:hypothetical protein PACTADRAFT_46253 [Pachysolen tannophilus NRRL Y-2460]|uniref:NADH-cytochrome b5 reductase n=1 Tax=Pachysolen tannophilus NRRL Y-2460 TaxID=669874 RepID=A0A1E4TQF7_PACTA|nr:hypothetical protein PACTADRAFT_46253 [Pachysolen tannophilus NRRL Y-2460]
MATEAETQEKYRRNEELIKTPLHGIYIPMLLIIFGIGIQNYRYIPHTVAILLVYLAYNFIRAYRRKKSISKDKFKEFELIDKTVVSKNSAIYRFKLFRESENLDIPIGHHLCCSVEIDGKDEIAYYTPISSQYDLGFFDILVKSYPTGKVSKYFASLHKGQTVKFKGPVGRMSYQPNICKNLVMIAGGSGITPMLQVLSYITTTPEDLTTVKLLFANETRNDILLKDEIDELASKYPYFEVEYFLNEPSKNWKGKTGYITKDDIKESLIGDDYLDTTKIFICGPLEMRKNMLHYCEELGFPKGTLKSSQEDQVFCF